MWQETVRALETGALAELSVVAFVVAFALIVARALALSKATRDHARALPLVDLPPASLDAPADR